MKKIGIIGGGIWGSALAKLLSKNEVLIYARDKEIVSSINNYKFNPKLKYVVFNENVKSTFDIGELQNLDFIFVALPSQNVREVIQKLNNINNNQKIIIASKGIEIESKLFLYEVVKSVSNNKNICILSGPCFSNEVAQNLPTAVTLASKNRNLFKEVNSLFNSENFRLYYSKDLIGCQLGGAIKNIYAIASGILLGMNLGENAKSALIARSFVEIIRLGKALGAQQNTLFGLSGLGDLILTCNSLKSRNTSFGHLISSQPTISIHEHLKSLETTEGYYTVQAVNKIAQEKKVEMPIANSVYRILFEEKDIKEEIKKLMQRPIKDEFN